MTIADLNSKWWYRLMKVVWIFLLLSIITLGVGVAISENGQKIDQKASYIQCDDGKKIGHSENSFYFSDSGYVSAYYDEEFRRVCAAPVQDAPDGKKVIKISFLPAEKNYALVIKYIPRDWAKTIGYSTLFIFLVLFTSDIFRRVFYYIVLGKLFPTKN